MIDRLHPPCIRIGSLSSVDSVKAAKRALLLALHYGSALIAVDEFGVAYAMWPHGRHGRKVLRDGLHYVVGVFEPQSKNLDRRCKWFIETVSEAIYDAARESLDWQRVAGRQIAMEIAA